jgi:hypothetical protein
MRKFVMILTLAISFLAATGAVNAAKQGPPQCSPICPILR